MPNPNDQIIYNVAIRNGFTPTAARLIVAQARFESGDYTSGIFQRNKNTSGMKYAGQPLAILGDLAPYSERSASCKAATAGLSATMGPMPPCKNSDHYARFRTIEDSARDKIERNYKITMGGVTPEQLKRASSPEEFAKLLKMRGYYGDSEANYARGLRAKLLRMDVIDFYDENKTAINYGVIGAVLLGLGAYGYFLYKRGIISKK